MSEMSEVRNDDDQGTILLRLYRRIAAILPFSVRLMSTSNLKKKLKYMYL